MIRDATTTDLPSVAQGMVRLHTLHVDAFPAIYKPFTESAAASYLTDILCKPDFHVRVAIKNDLLVGHLVLAVETVPSSMFKHAQQYGHVTQMEVDPDFQNQGIGKQLLTDADSLAVQFGLDRILLDVWAFNESARAFFDAAGFEAFGSKLVRPIESNAG